MLSCNISERDEWGQQSWGHFRFHLVRHRDLLGSPVNLLLSSQKCQGAPCFPDLSKIITSAAAPLVLTPFVRNQDLQIRESRVSPLWEIEGSRSRKGALSDLGRGGRVFADDPFMDNWRYPLVLTPFCPHPIRCSLSVLNSISTNKPF